MSPITWYGIILNQVNSVDFDALITAFKDASDWNSVAVCKRIAELAGYYSPAIDKCVEAFLENQAMFTDYAVPKTGVGNFFDIGYCYVLHGFRWAKELNSQIEKWNVESCFEGLSLVLQNEGKAYYRCNPDTGEGDQYYAPNTRMYECNQLANCFWNLYEAGVQNALTDIKFLWNDLQNHWKTDHYTYQSHNISGHYVWDGPQEALQVFGKLALLSESLTNFERLALHMAPGFLNDNWESGHFCHVGTKYHFVVHESSVNWERRMHGQFLAWAFLWQMWNRMTTAQKNTFRNMCMGTEEVSQAWQVMLESDHTMFNIDTNQFRIYSTEDFTDLGTALGATLLFLMGISPSITAPHGALAIPLETVTLGSVNMVDFQCFRWDYNHRKIRIPVFAGNLTFMYGSENVSYNFPQDGVYHVYFNDDYTRIRKVVQVSELPNRYYLDRPVTYHKTFQIIKLTYQQSGSVATVLWRKLELMGRDGETGWFTETYSEREIEAIITLKTVSSTMLNPGIFTATTYDIYTAYPINNIDQIIYLSKLFEVKNLQLIPLGNKIFCYKAEIIELPLTEAS